MSAKLTESGWKNLVQKYKLKDKFLQKALGVYEFIDDDEYEDRLTQLANLGGLTAELRKSKEILPLPEAVKYLADLANAIQAEVREVTKAKTTAEKAASAARKKTSEDDEGDEEDEEDAEYESKLLKSLLKLKGSKGAAYEFVVCDAKPFCAVMVAKKITAQHKAELTTVTGGSKRFLKPGTCEFKDGSFTFLIDEPVAGLARKIQASIKNFTGKKYPITAGEESAEEGDEEGPDKPSQTAPGSPARLELAKAPQLWDGTRELLAKNLTNLKAAIRSKFGNEQPEFIEEASSKMEKLDTILSALDRRLSTSLTKASQAEDGAKRAAELRTSKAILAEYIQHVKADPLIAHVDANPFGVKTNLKAVLVSSLTRIAQSIG